MLRPRKVFIMIGKKSTHALMACESKKAAPQKARLLRLIISGLETLADSEEVLSFQCSATDQTTINVLLSEDLGSIRRLARTAI